MSTPLLTAPLLVVATASGAALGSAAGSALIRWPDGGSVVRPARSRCGGCGEAVRARDLLPVISWLMLGGRCRSCHGRIDPRLPLLEASSALGVLAVVVVHGPGLSTGLLAMGVVAVLLATLTDFERRIIPDRLTLPFAVICVTGSVLLASEAGERWGIVMWALLVPILIDLAGRVTVALGARRPIGRGDVKLLVGLLALSYGFPAGPARLVTLALVIGGIHAAVALAMGTVGRRGRLPFAPSIALAFLVVVLLPDSTIPLGGVLEVLR